MPFRQLTQLPLDDVLYRLQETIPHLSRSSLHRCLKRHGSSVLPQKERSASADKKNFKQYPMGSFHRDIAEVRTAERTLYWYVAIDRTSQFGYGELDKSQTKMIAAAFLSHLIKAVPYKIYKVVTDNGIEFRNHDHPKNAFTDILERDCKEHQIEDRKTKIKHAWTNGQGEGMNRKLEEGRVNSFDYAWHDERKQDQHDYVMAYKFAKGRKAMKGKTRWQCMLNEWTMHAEYFILNPNHFLLGLNT